MSLLTASTEAELAALLASHGVDTSLWGTGEAKTLAHLLKELTEGECTLVLQGGQILRQVRGSHVLVTFGSLWLKEAYQLFADGRRRTRDLTTSVGEKARPGETGEEAALRALSEELGITLSALFLSGHRLEEKTASSVSYPGLTSVYVTDRYDVELPKMYFQDVYEEHQPDKTTRWVWAHS